MRVTLDTNIYVSAFELPEGVHRFLVSIRQREFLALFAQPQQGSARPVLVRRAAIVVPELDQHIVAGFQFRPHLFPQTLRDEGAAAAPG